MGVEKEGIMEGGEGVNIIFLSPIVFLLAFILVIIEKFRIFAKPHGLENLGSKPIIPRKNFVSPSPCPFFKRKLLVF